tara:strand:- start:923 stop:1495 length:573 start_codon:yes stop_codon:yes gene_type:complete
MSDLGQIEWGHKRIRPGYGRAWLAFPTLNPDRVWVGYVTKRGSKWEPSVPPEPDGGFALCKTAKAAVYALVVHHLDMRTRALHIKLKPPMHFPYRPSLILTDEQANAVWDVLVSHWAAHESNREGFVQHLTHTSPPDEWRCGYGKFRNNHYSFGVSQYAEDVTPWSRWLMARCGVALEKLYAEWFSKEAS